MRIYAILTAAVLGPLFHQSVLGQQSEFCLELAKRDLFDRFAGSTFNAGYTQSQSAYCRRFNEQKNSNTTLGIGYGDLSLDFGHNDARATAELVCSSKFDEAAFQQSASSLSRVLSANAVEAIRSCANKNGLIVVPKFHENGDLVVVDASYIPLQGEAVPSRKIREPIKIHGQIKCEGTLATAQAGTTLDHNAMSMTCSRKTSQATTVDGVYGKSTVYAGGTVTILTNAGSVSVSLPKKVEGQACSPQPVVFSEPEKSYLCRGCLPYGNLITDTLQASRGGNANMRQLTYRVDVPNCGDYKLVAKYAMTESRPVKLTLNGKPISTPILARTTGGLTNPAEHVELILPLRAGSHVFRLERQGAFPHLGGVELLPL